MSYLVFTMSTISLQYLGLLRRRSGPTIPKLALSAADPSERHVELARNGSLLRFSASPDIVGLRAGPRSAACGCGVRQLMADRGHVETTVSFTVWVRA